MGPREKRNKALGEELSSAGIKKYGSLLCGIQRRSRKDGTPPDRRGEHGQLGGSASVRESGLIEALKDGNYTFYDRDLAPTPEEKEKIARKAFECDWYLGSVNAMSEDGVFVNIDGNANRVAGSMLSVRKMCF